MELNDWTPRHATQINNNEMMNRSRQSFVRNGFQVWPNSFAAIVLGRYIVAEHNMRTHGKSSILFKFLFN